MTDRTNYLKQILDWLATNMTDAAGDPAEHNDSGTLTMPVTPGTVVTVNIPSDAVFVQITPVGTPVSFAINEAPVNTVSLSGTTVNVGDLGVGNIARAGKSTKRRLPSDASTLQLISTAISPVVDVEFFG